jgi:hypothetical protein
MNGAAVALPLELEPLPASNGTKITVPTEIQRAIGAATADAAVTIGQAISDFEVGGTLGLRTRALGGDIIARVCKLQLDHFGEFDFGSVAREAGRRELQQRHAAALRAQLNLSESALDQALDQLVRWVLEITTRVVANERARAN